MGEVAISLKNVSKCYKRYARPIDKLKELLLPGKIRAEEFWALRDINLEIPKGETFGIIGRNGSGKSTLLQIIAGTLQPTSGAVQVNGRVSALLELGSGFNPEFTGRQNVFFNGRILGLSQEEIENRFDEIAAFADIGEFIEQPVKTYSSGMRARLGFAVASSVDPDVLIVDEVLAVGDAAFQHKCMKRMRNMMEQGTTTLFVSHSPGSVKTLCTWAVMLHLGITRAFGKPDAVLAKYMKLITDEQVKSEYDNGKKTQIIEQAVSEKSNQEVEVIEAVPKSFRRGSGKAKIERILLKTDSGQILTDNSSCDFNEIVSLSVSLRCLERLESAIVGFFICDRNGNEVIGSNTLQEGTEIGSLSQSEEIEVCFQFRIPLKPGSYSLTVAVSEDYTNTTFDWVDNALTFLVLPPTSGKRIHAMVYVPMEVSINSYCKKVNSIVL